MELRAEAYYLESGYGSIDLKGDEFDCAIYFKGKPYAINWHDCAGSIGQYLVRTGIEGYRADLRQIRHIIEFGMKDDQMISTQISQVRQFELSIPVLSY